MMGSSTSPAIERLKEARSPFNLRPEERGLQLEELLRLTDLLDRGSTSLNQRATTLAALAVAALGAFGAFATRLGDVQTRGFMLAAAVLLVIATAALLVAALFALSSIKPAGQWSENFAARAEPTITGTTDGAVQAAHLVTAIQVQLERNKSKADDMKRAYEASKWAIIFVALAVIVIGVDAMLG